MALISWKFRTLSVSDVKDPNSMTKVRENAYYEILFVLGIPIYSRMKLL